MLCAHGPRSRCATGLREGASRGSHRTPRAHWIGDWGLTVLHPTRSMSTTGIGGPPVNVDKIMTQLKYCRRCGELLREGSFYTDGSHSAEICKPCIHRPRRRRVRAQRAIKTRERRAEIAVRLAVKQIQSGQSFVYLVEGVQRYKIGTSLTVDKRMRQLETASSQPLRLIAVAPGGRQLEQVLHRRFWTFRVHREWFTNTNHILKGFSELPGSMVFLPGYLTESPPPTVIG